MPLAGIRAGACDGQARVYALGLLLVLVVLVPLAHASPPDPLWIAGIYDGADLDEVVVAVVSATGLFGTPVVLAVHIDIPAGMVRPRDTALRGRPLAWTFGIRAPPFAKLMATT